MNSMGRRINQVDIEQFQEELTAQREQAWDFLRRLEVEQRSLDTDRPPELGDFCTETATREYFFERISQQRRLLRRIDIALERIRAGSFGECIACGESIPQKRLKVMPWTGYCLRCQEERERERGVTTPPSAYVGGERRAA